MSNLYINGGSIFFMSDFDMARMLAAMRIGKGNMLRAQVFETDQALMLLPPIQALTYTSCFYQMWVDRMISHLGLDEHGFTSVLHGVLRTYDGITEWGCNHKDLLLFKERPRKT